MNKAREGNMLFKHVLGNACTPLPNLERIVSSVNSTI